MCPRVCSFTRVRNPEQISQKNLNTQLLYTSALYHVINDWNLRLIIKAIELFYALPLLSVHKFKLPNYIKLKFTDN